jgi:hypothetical protein
MLNRKLMIVAVGAVMALAGCRAMYKDMVHDVKVLRGEVEAGETIMGNSTTVEATASDATSMEYMPPAFEILHIKANADVKVHRADTPKIVIAAPPDLRDKIELWTEKDKLEIRMAGNAQTSPRFSVDVYCPPLSAVGAAENSTLEFSSDVTQSEFTVGQLENGEIKGSIDCESIRLDMVGNGTMVLTGSAKTATIDMIGDGTIDAQNLIVNKTNVNVVGKGKILTWTTDNLFVLGVGFGTVHYRGAPSVRSLDMGPVRVIKLPDADTSDNSHSTKPAPKPIGSALALPHTVLGKPQ